VGATSVTRADLPPTAVALLELVARGFDVTSGPVTVDLTFQDGMLQTVFLKQRLNLTRVREFDAVFAEAWRIERGHMAGARQKHS